MKYRTIVADPPWPIGGFPRRPSRPDVDGAGPRRPGEQNLGTHDVPYPTMTLDAIETLPIQSLAESEAHLYIWTINAHMEDTFRFARAWGFKPVKLLTWCKAPMGTGLGGTFSNTTEHVLFARRGSLAARRRVDSTWWQWKRPVVPGTNHLLHSAKPEAFLDLVETVSPGPYLELFARRNRLGWDTWGNESLEHISLTEQEVTA